MSALESKKKMFLILACLAALALNACGALPPAAQATPTAVVLPTDAPTAIPTLAPSPTPLPALTTDALKNATYLMKDFASMNGGSDTVTLVDGKFSLNQPAGSGGSQVFNLTYIQSTTGDLNADGAPDAAVILAADTQGSGTFIYLAAVINQGGKAAAVDSVALGDRTLINALVIQDGAISLQMVTHGPQDPMCCPSLKVNETYLLENNHLLSQTEKTAAPLAQGVIQALKAKDMTKLASFVDPKAGVRFSPYTNVKQADLVFTPDKLAGALTDATSYLWGTMDGSGAPIQLTFADYYAKFVYSLDFASATQVGYNQTFSSGNLIDNSRDFYPNSIIVEYYLPGTDPSQGGMDWQSLKLVFQQSGSQWYLVGIIHSQWTI